MCRLARGCGVAAVIHRFGHRRRFFPGPAHNSYVDILRTRDLLQAAMTKRQIRAAVRDGALTRIRRGRYATSEPDSRLDQQLLQATRRGGCLSCISVLAQFGVHVPDDGRCHIRLPRGTIGKSCRPYGSNRHPVEGPMDAIEIALACAVRCLEPEALLACLDTSLSKGLVHESQVRAMLRLAPPRKRALLQLIGRVDSGQESILKYRLHQLRILFRMHQRLRGIGVVDFLIGACLILELDGREYHSDAAAFERDRRRDADALRAGYIVLRFTWRQLMFEWEEVKTRILEIVRADGHRRPRRCFASTTTRRRRPAVRTAGPTNLRPAHQPSRRPAPGFGPAGFGPAGLLATWSVLTNLGRTVEAGAPIWKTGCLNT